MAAQLVVEQPGIDSNLFTELYRLCREGHYEELRELLHCESNVLDYFQVRTQRGNTLVHEAVEADQADIVQLLLLYGVQPDLRAKSGLTPLHMACAKGHVECVRALLEGGADLKLTDDFGNDSLAKAERSKKREPILRLLRSKGVCMCVVF